MTRARVSSEPPASSKAEVIASSTLRALFDTGNSLPVSSRFSSTPRSAKKPTTSSTPCRASVFLTTDFARLVQ